mmetsp:Transcript_62594/g.99066  ORF Transcript_62594/g.99066 Transcript_62594/m.99066 type:complete len:307 (+) Transcript_62594:180-1100(+)
MISMPSYSPKESWNTRHSPRSKIRPKVSSRLHPLAEARAPHHLFALLSARLDLRNFGMRFGIGAILSLLLLPSILSRTSARTSRGRRLLRDLLRLCGSGGCGHLLDLRWCVALLGRFPRRKGRQRLWLRGARGGQWRRGLCCRGCRRARSAGAGARRRRRRGLRLRRCGQAGWCGRRTNWRGHMRIRGAAALQAARHGIPFHQLGQCRVHGLELRQAWHSITIRFPLDAISQMMEVLPVGHRSHVCLALQTGHQGLQLFLRGNFLLVGLRLQGTVQYDDGCAGRYILLQIFQALLGCRVAAIRLFV